MDAQKKAAGLGAGEAAQHNILKRYCSASIPKTQGLLRALTRRIWIAEYKLENRRQSYAALGRLGAEAACCIALAVLKFGRLI